MEEERGHKETREGKREIEREVKGEITEKERERKRERERERERERVTFALSGVLKYNNFLSSIPKGICNNVKVLCCCCCKTILSGMLRIVMIILTLLSVKKICERKIKTCCHIGKHAAIN